KQPCAITPPPRWPPSTTPSEINLESAVDIRGCASHLLIAPPPPPPINVICADLGAGNGIPVGTKHSTGDSEVATPIPPPPPVVGGNSNRIKGQFVLVCPLPAGHVNVDRLQSFHLLGRGSFGTEDYSHSTWTFLKAQRGNPLSFFVELHNSFIS